MVFVCGHTNQNADQFFAFSTEIERRRKKAAQNSRERERERHDYALMTNNNG